MHGVSSATAKPKRHTQVISRSVLRTMLSSAGSLLPYAFSITTVAQQKNKTYRVDSQAVPVAHAKASEHFGLTLRVRSLLGGNNLLTLVKDQALCFAGVTALGILKSKERLAF